MEIDKKFFYSEPFLKDSKGHWMIKNNEIILADDNNTQFNFQKLKDNKWDHFMGCGFLTNNYTIWANFISKCSFLDIEDDFLWGLGKYKDIHKEHSDSLMQVVQKFEKQFSDNKNHSRS